MRKLLLFSLLFYSLSLSAQEPIFESNSYVYSKQNYSFDFFNVFNFYQFSDGSINVSPYSNFNVTIGNTFAKKTFKGDDYQILFDDILFYKNRKFIAYANKLLEILPNKSLKKIFFYQSGEEFRGCHTDGNLIYFVTQNISKNTFKLYSFDGKTFRVLKNFKDTLNTGYALYRVKNKIYLANYGGKQKLALWQINKNKLINPLNYPFKCINFKMLNLDEIYFYDKKNKLFFYNHGVISYINPFNFNDFGLDYGLSKDYLRFNNHIKNNNYLLKLNKDKIDTLAVQFNTPKCFPSLENKESNSYYIGSGVNLYRVFPLIKKYSRIYNKSNAQQIFSLAQAKDGKIWAGSYNGSLSIIDKNRIVETPFKDLFLNGSKNIGDKILMNLEAKNGILLFENHKTKPKKISDTLISFYNFLSRDSTLYLGTSTYGLAYAKWKNVLANKKINWRFISKEKGNHLYNNICIAEDKFGNIWSSQKGFSIYQPYKDKAITWSKEKNEVGFSSLSMLTDNKKTLWVGSYDGKLFYYDGKNRDDLSPKNFRSISHPLLEGNKIIYFMHQWKNYLILGAYDKILLFDLEKWYREKKVLVRYLNSMETNFSAPTEQNTCLTDFRDESIWFSTSDMLYQWNIKDWLKLATFKVIPEIVLKKDTLENHLQVNQKFQLKPKENSFEVEIRYQTKDNMPRYISASLAKEGEKPVFEAPNLETHFKFQNLSSGNYVFYVRVCQQDGSFTIHQFKIEIEKFLWQKWWFWFLVSLFPIAMIVYYYHKKNEINVQKKQISQLNLSNLSNQFRPHFMLNALNSIGSQMEDKPHAEKVISRLGESINILYDFTTKNTFYHYFKKEWKLVSNVIEIQKLLFIPELQTVIHHLEIMNTDFKIPIGLLQIPIENALLHGLRNREEAPYLLEINFSENEEQFIISIKDNGVGRKKSKEINNFKKNGNGLKTIEKMVNIINKRQQNAIHYKINDLLEGTEVIITLNKTIDYEKIQL